MSSVSTRIKGLVDQAQDTLADMTPRDRTLLLGLIVATIVFIIGGATWWMNSTLSALEGRVEDRELALGRVQVMASEHAAAQEQAAQIEMQLMTYAGTELSSFLEKAARDAKVQDRLAAVREKSTATDGNIEERLYTVALNNLSLAEMANFLYEVETSGYPLRIQTFRVKTRTSNDTTQLNVDMDISAFRLLDTTPTGEEG